jgi:hypothetical protein
MLSESELLDETLEADYMFMDAYDDDEDDFDDEDDEFDDDFDEDEDFDEDFGDFDDEEGADI